MNLIQNRKAFFSGCILLITGYLYYLVFRGYDPLSLFGVLPSAVSENNWYSLWGSWPTLLHTCGFALLTYGFWGKNRYRIVLLWVVINCLFELAQLPLFGKLLPGVFSISDLLAAAVGALLFLLLMNYLAPIKKIRKVNTSQIPFLLKYFSSATILVIGVFSITASVKFDIYCEDCYTNGATPIYLSYEDLRGPLTVQQDKKLNNPGKIYTYNQYLFINERNEGVHVFNNADPANPQSLGFIKLPGNLDIAIKEGYLYADSFIDLVVIDLNDPSQPTISKRIEDIFPYDPYQVIDSDESVYFYDLDESRGVVIGYQQNSGQS